MTTGKRGVKVVGQAVKTALRKKGTTPKGKEVEELIGATNPEVTTRGKHADEVAKEDGTPLPSKKKSKFSFLEEKYDPVMAEVNAKQGPRTATQKEIGEVQKRRAQSLDLRNEKAKASKKGTGRASKGRTAEPVSKEKVDKLGKYYKKLQEKGYTDGEIATMHMHARSNELVPEGVNPYKYVFDSVPTKAKAREELAALPAAERSAQRSDTTTPNALERLARASGEAKGKDFLKARRKQVVKGKDRADYIEAQRLLREGTTPEGTRATYADKTKAQGTVQRLDKLLSPEEIPTEKLVSQGDTMRMNDKVTKLASDGMPPAQIAKEVAKDLDKVEGLLPTQKARILSSLGLGLAAGAIYGVASRDYDEVDEEFTGAEEPPKKTAREKEEKEEKTGEGGEGGEGDGDTDEAIEGFKPEELPDPKTYGLGPESAKDINTEDDLRAALSNYTAAMNKLADEYRKTKSGIDKRRKWEKLIEGIAQIAGSLYGLANGIPVGKIDFDSTDWGQEYNRLMAENQAAGRTAASQYGIAKDIAGAKAQDFQRRTAENKMLYDTALRTVQGRNAVRVQAEQLRQGMERIQISRDAMEIDKALKGMRERTAQMKISESDMKFANQLEGQIAKMAGLAAESKGGPSSRGVSINNIRPSAKQMRRVKGSFLPDRFWPDTESVSSTDVLRFTGRVNAWEEAIDDYITITKGDPNSREERIRAQKELENSPQAEKMLNDIYKQLNEGY